MEKDIKKYLEFNGVMTVGIENPEKVGKKSFPNTKLEFMKKVQGKEAIKVEVK